MAEREKKPAKISHVIKPSGLFRSCRKAELRAKSFHKSAFHPASQGFPWWLMCRRLPRKFPDNLTRMCSTGPMLGIMMCSASRQGRHS